jgi:hypothetical protein
MKKALATALMVLTVNAQAQSYMQDTSWDNPTAQFDATQTITDKSVIIWKRVDDVQAGCNAESKRLGVATVSYQVQACSFYNKNTCTIITGKTTSQHSLGHELRHCFQGSWHK